MNLVAFIGSVASEPTIMQTSSLAVCTFTLAVSRLDEGEADFFTVVTTGRQAEVCNMYLSVGRRISVEGSLRHAGGKTEILANRVELLGAKRVRI